MKQVTQNTLDMLKLIHQYPRVSDIIKCSGKTEGAIRVAIHRLHRNGFIERGILRGTWKLTEQGKKLLVLAEQTQS